MNGKNLVIPYPKLTSVHLGYDEKMFYFLLCEESRTFPYQKIMANIIYCQGLKQYLCLLFKFIAFFIRQFLAIIFMIYIITEAMTSCYFGCQKKSLAKCSLWRFLYVAIYNLK